MRITVDRALGESYLVLEEDRSTFDHGAFLETRMLTENRIDGILPMQIRNTDEMIRYQYPVSGKATLKQVYERSQIGTSSLKSLIAGVQNAFLCAQEYLLMSEHILLDPEYIFVDPKDQSIHMCICPAWNIPVADGLQTLAEYLISITDHKEDTAIDLSYGFYRKVAAKDYSFENLLTEERIRTEETVPVKEERTQEPVKRTRSAAGSILGFAAVFALIVCFTMCLLVLKFR